MTDLQILEQELRTEDGLILNIQEKIANKTFDYLFHHGFLFDGVTNTEADTKLRKWVWETEWGTKMTFTNPYYRDMVSVRSVPIEKGRTPEEALSLTTSNRSSAAIKRNISKEHVVYTNAKITKTDTFDFNVTAGFGISGTTGITGQATNAGATGLLTVEASLEASFGGSFVNSWANEKGESTKRVVSDTLELEPLSEYSIVANVDKIDLEQTLNFEGIADFEMELDLTNAVGQATQEHSFKLNKYKVTSLKELARLLLAITGDPISREKKWNKNKGIHGDQWAANMRGMLDAEYRKVKAETTLEYKDAGDISMTVIKVGSWSNDGNEWTLNRLI